MTKDVQLSDVTHHYLRVKKRFPNVWCAGCGIGTVMGSIIRAVDFLEYKKDEVALVSGIGCSSRLPVYCDFNTLHTTHGRALAFATGVKVAKPGLKVIVITGDGDGLAIGGNHFIHACRRNIDITAIVMNNNIYGMTGGQASPTTPVGARATTAPYGAIDTPFDICRLAEGAGASYVARATIAQPALCEQYIKKAIQKKGFSVVEIITHCHTQFGRKNKRPNPVDNLIFFRENSVPKAKAKEMTEEEKKGKIIIGEFVDREGQEYTEAYLKLIERVRG